MNIENTRDVNRPHRHPAPAPTPAQTHQRKENVTVIEELMALLLTLKELLMDLRAADETLLVNLEGWADAMGEYCAERFCGIMTQQMNKPQPPCEVLLNEIRSLEEKLDKTGEKPWWSHLVANAVISAMAALAVVWMAQRGWIA